MKPRTLQRWILWLLPLMLLRAFVPAGFMLSAHAGELSVVFCSSVRAPASSNDGPSAPWSESRSGEPTATARSLHHEHGHNQTNHLGAPGAHHTDEHQSHHGSKNEGSEHNATGTNSCPYALIATTPAGHIEFFLSPPANESYPQQFTALLFSSYGPQRSEFIRGPPAFI